MGQCQKGIKLLFATLGLIIILVIYSDNFADGAKSNKKGQEIKYSKIGGEEEENDQIEEGAANRWCPEKGSVPTGGSSSLAEEDVQGATLLRNYRVILLASDGLADAVEFVVRTDSVVWFLKRKLSDLLQFVEKWARENENGETVIRAMEGKRREWREAGKRLEKRFDKKERMLSLEYNKGIICIYTKFIVLIINYMLNFGSNVEEWQIYLRKHGLTQMFQVSTFNCENDEEINGLFDDFTNAPTVGQIIKSNLSTMLKKHAHFRHFFCHEVKMGQVKPRLNDLIQIEQLIKLEDKFPEVLRIDIMMVSTIYERFRHLFTNLSTSPTFKFHLRQLWMAYMIGYLSIVENPEKFDVGTTIRNAFREKVYALHSSVFRNMSSDRHLCVLFKFYKYFIAINPEKPEKLSEKSVKKWEAKECSDQKEQRQALDDLNNGYLGQQIRNGVESVVHFLPEKFKAIIGEAGARTRLKIILGSQKLYDELKNGPVTNLLPKNEFENVDLLPTLYHYALSTSVHAVDWFPAICKLAADFLVFMRWLEQELCGHNLAGLWAKIKQYVPEKYYDPLFDLDRANLVKSGAKLATLFWTTKSFVASLIGKYTAKAENGPNAEKIFKIWREIPDKDESTMDQSDETEMAQMMQEMHRLEMETLIANGAMDKLLEDGSETLRKKLGIFLENDDIDELFEVPAVSKRIKYILAQQKQKIEAMEEESVDHSSNDGNIAEDIAELTIPDKKND